MACNPAGTQNSARLFYGDGASRSGYVKDPVSVPGNASQQMYFRGAKSLDSALDLLLSLGMKNADLIVFTGGSAGGVRLRRDEGGRSCPFVCANKPPPPPLPAKQTFS